MTRTLTYQHFSGKYLVVKYYNCFKMKRVVIKINKEIYHDTICLLKKFQFNAITWVN